MNTIKSVDTSKLLAFFSLYGLPNTVLANVLGISKQLFAKKEKANNFSEVQKSQLAEYLTAMVTDANSLFGIYDSKPVEEAPEHTDTSASVYDSTPLPVYDSQPAKELTELEKRSLASMGNTEESVKAEDDFFSSLVKPNNAKLNIDDVLKEMNAQGLSGFSNILYQ